IHHKLPICLSHLSDLVKSAKISNNYDDLLFATIMSCCFYVCHQSGELIQKSRSKKDWRKIIKRCSLNFSSGYAGYHLPYHKTDPFFHGTNILFTHHDVADPVDLLHQYVMRQDHLHGAHSPLFITEDSSYPSRSWFNLKLFLFVDCSFGWHSACVEGATYYTGLGISKNVIMAIGRWSSSAWRMYIHDDPCVRVALELADL
ncbi:hypothetical protein J132_08989, partial [Termitomyces sp. J132]